MLTSLERAPSVAPLFEILSGFDRERFNKFRLSLRGSRVVDVGGGDSTVVENFVLGNGAREYINVDPHPKLYPSTKEGVMLVREKAEKYLEEQTFYYDGGANFCINGLDEWSYKDGDFSNLADLVKMQMVSGNYFFGSGHHGLYTKYFPEDEYVYHVKNDRYFLFEKR